jgi:uncharacterized protein DUF1266
MPSLEPAQRWLLALGAILNERNKDDHDVLGGSLRPRHARRATVILASGWDVRTTGEARGAIRWLFDEGHRKPYEADGLGSAESFLGWDLCRAANVAGWSFVAYLIDRETAWDALTRAGAVLQGAFSSFAELGQSYLRGLRIWSESPDDPRVKESELALAKLCAREDGPYRVPWTTPLEGAPPPSIEQKEAHVAPGGSIEEAVASVGLGGRVVVSAGSYPGSLTPPHSVEIVAAGDGEVVIEAVDRPAVWAKKNVSVSLRGIEIRAGRSSEGKTLNATSVPGGYLRLDGCRVTASHHGASVREEGFLLLSKSVVRGTGQSGVWCDGGSVAAVGSELSDLGVHGAFFAKSPHANVLEETRVERAAQVGLFAEAELRVRRCSIQEPGKYGVAVHGPVWISDSAVRGSAGSGVIVELGGSLRLVDSIVSGSQSANLDVKEGAAYARSSAIAKGATSGVVLQGKARATLIETMIEDNAQGNLYAIPGARLVIATCRVRGDALGLFLQGAQATVVHTAIEAKAAPAIDVRGEPGASFLDCDIQGDLVVRAGSSVRIAACRHDRAPTTEEGATVDIVTNADIDEETRQALDRMEKGD